MVMNMQLMMNENLIEIKHMKIMNNSTQKKSNEVAIQEYVLMEINININCNKNNITMEFFNNESSKKEEQQKREF